MKKLLFVLLLLPLTAFGQSGTRYDNIVIDQHGEAVSFAKIRVCSAGSISVPCVPTVSLFNDINLTIPLANPVTADILGNFHFYATCGNRYTVQVSGTNITTYTMPDQLLACQTGGGGGGGCTAGSATECWSVSGNAPTVGTPTFGNTNAKDIRVITNNTERFRFGSAGGFTVTGDGNLGKFQWPTAFIKQADDVHGQVIGIGDGVNDHFTFTLRQRPIKPSTLTVFVNHVAKGTDNGAGGITGAGISGTGTINYSSGAIDVTFSAAPGNHEYVEVTDTITGNFFAGTTNTNAFTVVPNDLKVERAVGALFSVTDYEELTTEGTGGALTNSDFGTVANYYKNDSTDPVGLKKRYQVDSSGNEREYCYTDRGCFGPGIVNPAITGGIIGGAYGNATNGADGSMFATASLNNANFYFPSAAFLGPIYACIAGALNPYEGYTYEWQFFSRPNTVIVKDSAATNIYGNTSAGCQGGSQFGYSLFRLEQGSSFALEQNAYATPIANTTMWATEVRGAQVQPLGFLTTGTLNAGLTTNMSVGQPGGMAPWMMGTTDPDLVNVPIPFATTMRKLCAGINAAQPASGSLVFTLLKNNVATALVVTIAASTPSPMVPVCNLTDTVSFAAGDRVAVSITNNAAGGAQPGWVTWEALTNNDSTAMLVFPMGNHVLASSDTSYFQSFTNSPTNSYTTETDAIAAMPRAAETGTFYCWIQTGPATDPTTITLMKNSAPTTVTATVGTGATGLITGTGTTTFAAGDSYSLKVVTGPGGVMVPAACSIEIKPSL